MGMGCEDPLSECMRQLAGLGRRFDNGSGKK